jgi:hypothetical protein
MEKVVLHRCPLTCIKTGWQDAVIEFADGTGVRSEARNFQ